MATEQRPAHSPLGASGAERWLNCPGSVGLIKALGIEEESDEPDYKTLGTAAHAAACKCLETGVDAWELAGEQHGTEKVKHEVDLDIMNAIQMYVDECREIKAAAPGGKEYIEHHISAPEFHEDFYGTTDWAYVTGAKLFVRDYKHGMGVAVDIEWNPQVLYYAYGILRLHPEVDDVDLAIIQPRIPYGDKRKHWTVSAAEVRKWAEEVLKPGMERTALDHDLLPGTHCRFCPAKLVCPVMVSLFGAAMQANPEEVINLSMESLGRSYTMIGGVKSYIAALEKEMLRRLLKGDTTEYAKLVKKKADRVFKEGAVDAFRLKYGSTAIMTEPTIKSPAQMEKLGAEAKKMVSEWAYTPLTGYTVAAKDDKRLAEKVTVIEEKFRLPPEE